MISSRFGLGAALLAMAFVSGEASAQARLSSVTPVVPTTAVADAAVEREAYVMGTRLHGRVAAATRSAAAEALEAAFAEARSLESLLSTWRSDTELSAANSAPAGTAVALSPELLSILAEVERWVAETGGAFDPAVGALVDVWDVRGEGRTPSPAELEAALGATGWSRVALDRDAGTLSRAVEGVWLDAGAFGKGLALRRAARVLESRGVAGVLNFGGQVLVVGPESETIEVADPQSRSESTAVLRVAGGSVSTTSASERPGHVLDPRTGRSAAAWGSVTVVAEDAFVADLLSTALFVMGPDAALEWSADRPFGVLVQESTGEGVRVRSNAAMQRWLPGGVAAPVTAAGVAQDTGELARLRRQVEAITRELERMRLGADVVARADTSILGFGPAASKVYKVSEGVSIGGYGEVLYSWFGDELENDAPAGKRNEFDALRAIVYFGYRFSENLLFNSEIEIEHANEAFLEFAYLDYRLNPAFGLRGGLLLAPMGLVNELHEPPVFLGSTRPEVESEIIPTTWRENGFGVFGTFGPFSYRAYAMNGLKGATGFKASGLRGGRQKGSKALAEDMGYVIRADYEGVPGLLVGGSFYTGGSDQGEVIQMGAVAQEIDATTRIWEGHASYQSMGLDLRALVAGAAVEDAALINAFRGFTGDQSVGSELMGGYVHAGYDVLRAMDTEHQLLPYVRYEWINTQAEVPTGYEANPANDRTVTLLGAAWKPVPQVAIKGDYQIHKNQAETGLNRFSLAISYLF